MKCGNAFTKGHLNVCSAKEIVSNICKYKGHFGRLCKLKGRKPAVNTVDETVNSQNCSYSPEDLQARIKENFCGVINAWTVDSSGLCKPSELPEAKRPTRIEVEKSKIKNTPGREKN